jgi:hypothetical protein
MDLNKYSSICAIYILIPLINKAVVVQQWSLYN